MNRSGRRTSKGRTSTQRRAPRRKPVAHPKATSRIPGGVPVAAAEPPPPDVQTPRTAGVEHCVATPVHQAAATGAPEPNDLSAAERAAPSPAPSVSAEAAPQTSTGRVEEFLGFRLDNEEYCVWIRSIKEIIRPSEITPIPRSPADILGLISLRGTIVPIFNIRRRLGLPAGDVGPKSRIVVVVLDAGPVGMVVDHVTEVISIDPDALEPPPPTMGEREASLVTATVRFQERIVGVLHLDRLVAIDTEAPLQAVA